MTGSIALHRSAREREREWGELGKEIKDELDRKYAGVKVDVEVCVCVCVCVCV